MAITVKDALDCAWITVDGQGEEATFTVSAEDPSEIPTQPTRNTFPAVYLARTYQELCGYLQGYGLKTPSQNDLKATPEEIEEGGEVVRKVSIT